MLFKSPIYSQVSGSIAGLTYAHNTGGMYARQRSTPTNPATAAQIAARDAVGDLNYFWRNVATQAQRDAWTSWAATNPITGKLGDPLILSGQQMFIKCNAPRMRAALAAVVPGPTIAGLSAIGATSFVPNAAADDVDLTFEASAPWANEAGGYAFLQLGRQVAPTVNYYKGPWRLAGTVVGAATPPTSPATITGPFGETYLAGNKVFGRIIASRADGRPSMSVVSFGIAA